MKMTMILMCLLGICIGTNPPAEPTSDIPSIHFIENSMEGVFERAKKEGKMVFIDFYGTWCPPCKYLDREVFSNPDVEGYMEARFVCVKLDVDSKVGRKYADRLEVISLPTLMFVRADRKIVDRIEGALSPEDFLRVAKSSYSE